MAIAGGVLDAAVGDEVADVARFVTAVFATVGYEIAKI